jgi:hypothetical protein
VCLSIVFYEVFDGMAFRAARNDDETRRNKEEEIFSPQRAIRDADEH